MMNKPLISVIVPIYNVERFLNKCISSIINQTYSNLEIILVDDGSTDDSSVICNNFAQVDSRIHVINKNNGGQGSARNSGLRIAKGTYIAFLDSDDYFESNAIQLLYEEMISNNLDISSCNYNRVDINGVYISRFDNLYTDFIVSGKEAQIRMWYGEVINLSPWGKLFKRELWDGIYFKEYRNSEDYATMHYVYLRAHRFGYINKPLVNYTIRNNSSVRIFNDNKIEILDIADDTLVYAKTIDGNFYSAAVTKAVSTYFHIFLKLPSIKGEYSKVANRCKSFIFSHLSEVKNNNRANRRIKYALTIFRFSPGLLRLIYRIRKRHNILS